MENLREMMKEKPWIGWAVAGMLLVVALYLGFFRGGNNDDFSGQKMQEMVTIRFSDTDTTEEWPWGRVMKELSGRPGKLDPTVGINNPSTGKATGFIFNKAEWDRIVGQINKDKEEASKSPVAGSGKTKPTAGN